MCSCVTWIIPGKWTLIFRGNKLTQVLVVKKQVNIWLEEVTSSNDVNKLGVAVLSLCLQSHTRETHSHPHLRAVV